MWSDGGDDNSLAVDLRNDADGALICALRNAAPALLAELAALRSARSEARMDALVECARVANVYSREVGAANARLAAHEIEKRIKAKISASERDAAREGAP
jgi:hypothetical protein